MYPAFKAVILRYR